MKISQACAKVGRDPNDITIIGVTKYVDSNRAKQAVDAGIHHLGENRVEGLTDKYQALNGLEVVWHFIGSLQSKKTKHVIDKVDMLHSLDRMSLAKEINKRAERPVACFVQVNASGEASKHGIKDSEVISFIKQLQEFEYIRIVGLMTMAPLTEDTSIIRSTFRKLGELRKQVQKLKLEKAPCTELSMGMSNDYQIAIEEGATYLRIGSSLVGSNE